MNHIEQAALLKRSIHEAKVDLMFACDGKLTEDELKFRFDTLVGILTIASQEMSALIDNWQTAESLAQTLPPSDDKLFTVAPDPNCEFCAGDGLVFDRVDYGSATIPMQSYCECVEEQISVELDDTCVIELMIPNVDF